MDGFFLSIFLAVCVVVAVLMRCICYRSSCVRRVLSSHDDVILPRRSAPVITPSRSHRRNQQHQHQQQQQQHQQELPNSPQLPDGASPDSPPPILPHSGAVFTIYTFEQQPSPLLQRPSSARLLLDPPKYSSLPADAPPKYEDLFPALELCTSCKANMSLPPFPLHDAPASSSTACPAVHAPCSSSLVAPSAAPPTSSAVSPAHSALPTDGTRTSNTIHSHRSGLSGEDSPPDTTALRPSDGE